MNCRSPRLWSAVFPTLVATLLATSPLTVGSHSSKADAATLPVSSSAVTEIKGAIPPLVAKSTPGSLLDPSTNLTFSFILPFRNQPALDKAVAGMYDPKSPTYGQFLTHAQFESQYGASAADFAAVKAYALSQGFTIQSALPSNKVLIVSAPASAVEAAFGTQFSNFTAPDGRSFFAALSAPKVPADIAGKIIGIGGLSNAAIMRPHLSKIDATKRAVAIAEAKVGIDTDFATRPTNLDDDAFGSRILTADDTAETVGTGSNGGLTPTDIYQAYNFKPYTLGLTPATPYPTGFGKGQTLGLYELDVFSQTDITEYETMFNLPLTYTINTETTTETGLPPATPLGGNDEVDLDIELMIAMAPLGTAIDVYETENASLNGVPYAVTLYQVIADADMEQEISTSWGTSEINQTQGDLDGEEAAFEQMAAQGQSIFAAAGDSGAFDDTANSEASLQVDDPASDPFMTATGGTTLNVTTPGVAPLVYASESSWGTPASGTGATATAASGGGGGVSRVWSMPSYQQGVVPNSSAIPSGYPTAYTDAAYPANPDPTKMRNEPDLSIDANPDSGYDIAFDGAAGEVEIVGGTSAAAPLWAGITARINEQRALNGLGPIGFFNPMLYAIGKDGYAQVTYEYPTTMHDVQDGTTNLYFPAVKGYDNSTGWGTPNGAEVITEYGSPTPTNFGVSQGDLTDHLHWDAMPKATHYNIYKSTSPNMANASKIQVKTNGFIDKPLNNLTTYYYQIQAGYSNAGSNRTGTMYGIPQVVSIRSTAPPSVSSGNTAITVAWVTNSVSDSTVVYGTSATSLTGTVHASNLLRDHSLTITGLTPGKTYYYQFSSTDEQNKVATSKVAVVSLPTR